MRALFRVSVVVVVCLASCAVADTFTHKKTGEIFKGQLTGAKINNMHKVIKENGAIAYIRLGEYKIVKDGTGGAVAFEPCLGAAFHMVKPPPGLGGYTGDLLAVDFVFSDSAARDAGLRPGDVILSVNENAVRSEAAVMTHLKRNGPKNPAKVLVWRDGARHTVEVTPDSTADTTLVFRIRIDDELGLGFGRVFSAALEEARSLRAKYILVEIDSPGGMVHEATRASADLLKVRGAETIALVKQGRHRGAISAAALLTLSCDRLFMQPGTSIGGATPYAVEASSGNAMVDEKMMSIFRAQFRAVAEARKRPVLPCMAMVDPNLSVWFARPDKTEPFFFIAKDFEEAKRLLDRSPARGQHINVTHLSRKGKLATLTAADAASYGLCKTVTTLDDLCVAVKIKRPRIHNSAEWKRELARIEKMTEAFGKEREQFAKYAIRYNELLKLRAKATTVRRELRRNPMTGQVHIVEFTVANKKRIAEIDEQLLKCRKAMIASLKKQLLIIKPYPELEPYAEHLKSIGLSLSNQAREGL
jgi:hypothetical protein